MQFVHGIDCQTRRPYPPPALYGMPNTALVCARLAAPGSLGGCGEGSLRPPCPGPGWGGAGHLAGLVRLLRALQDVGAALGAQERQPADAPLVPPLVRMPAPPRHLRRGHRARRQWPPELYVALDLGRGQGRRRDEWQCVDIGSGLAGLYMIVLAEPVNLAEGCCYRNAALYTVWEGGRNAD